MRGEGTPRGGVYGDEGKEKGMLRRKKADKNTGKEKPGIVKMAKRYLACLCLGALAGTYLAYRFLSSRQEEGKLTP